jgi:hypothetical protein
MKLMTLNQTLFFQHEEAPPHIHNKVTTFLNRPLPKQWFDQSGIHVLAPIIARSDAPRLSHLGLYERHGLSSTNSYNLEQAGGSNKKTARPEQPLLQMFGIQLSIT